jgi:anaerobic sulfite reductase subunit C
VTVQPHDIDRKAVTRNAWRVTKDRELTCLRIRVPGGHLHTAHFELIRQIAESYGNSTVHLTTRQGFEIPGIRWEHMPAVNALLKPLIDALDLARASDAEGYPAAGTRNISACIGSRVCPFANADTTALAQRLERLVYPHDLHFKIAVTGCPNDCIKAHMQDFGILCTTIPQYDAGRCISCKACVDTCTQRVTGALSMPEFDVVRDPDLCIGCGECVKACPSRAWTRSAQPYYRMVIMGRTGKKNPRLAATFCKWASEPAIMGIISNAYGFVERYIDKTLAKEHVGYIVDRQGYARFREEVLAGVPLNPEIRIAAQLQWQGYAYADDPVVFGTEAAERRG